MARHRAIAYVHSAKDDGDVEVFRTLNDVRLNVVEYDGNHPARLLSLYAEKVAECEPEQVLGPS